MPDYSMKLFTNADEMLLRKLFKEKKWPMKRTLKTGVFYLVPKEVGPVVRAFVEADLPFVLQHK